LGHKDGEGRQELGGIFKSKDWGRQGGLPLLNNRLEKKLVWKWTELQDQMVQCRPRPKGPKWGGQEKVPQINLDLFQLWGGEKATQNKPQRV